MSFDTYLRNKQASASYVVVASSKDILDHFLPLQKSQFRLPALDDFRYLQRLLLQTSGVVLCWYFTAFKRSVSCVCVFLFVCCFYQA